MVTDGIGNVRTKGLVVGGLGRTYLPVSLSKVVSHEKKFISAGI